MHLSDAQFPLFFTSAFYAQSSFYIILQPIQPAEADTVYRIPIRIKIPVFLLIGGK